MFNKCFFFQRAASYKTWQNTNLFKSYGECKKDILKSSLHTKIYVQQAFFLFSVHSTKLSNGEYKKVVTTKKLVNTNLAIKLRQYDF